MNEDYYKINANNFIIKFANLRNYDNYFILLFFLYSRHVLYACSIYN